MLGQVIATEFLKLRRAKITWLTALGIAIGPLFGGLFMWILQEPGRAERLAGSTRTGPPRTCSFCR